MAQYLYPAGGNKRKRAESGGHDFWFTRNGAGVGFWEDDRGWSEEEGKAMDEYCEKKGSFDLYVGDDGKIYN